MSSEPVEVPKVELPERNEAFDLSGFDCPRCGATVAADAYGPCADCVTELKATQRGEIDPGGVAAAAYEPKMNVTPNAVALKDD